MQLLIVFDKYMIDFQTVILVDSMNLWGSSCFECVNLEANSINYILPPIGLIIADVAGVTHQKEADNHKFEESSQGHTWTEYLANV